MTDATFPKPSFAGPASAMGAMVFFTVNDTIIKYFSDTYALHQLVFARCSIAIVLIITGVFLFGDGWASFKTRRLPAHLLRGSLVVMANVAFFLAVAAMPLGEAVAIFFVSPLLITAFSAIFLKETVGPWRWVAVAIGLAGVLVIVRPGSATFQIASLLPIFAATCYAGLHMMTRTLGRTDSTPALAFYVQVVFIVSSVTIGLIVGDGRFADQSHPSAAFFFRAWAWPEAAHWPLYLLLGICVGAGAYLISAAYRMSQAALIAPFEYIAMPISIFWGVILFDEWPDAIAWMGISLIVGAGFLMLWREGRSGTSAAAPVARLRR